MNRLAGRWWAGPTEWLPSPRSANSENFRNYRAEGPGAGQWPGRWWLGLVLAVAALGADFSGQWNFKAFSPEGEDPAKLTITQDGEKINGAFDSFRGTYKLEGTVKGQEIRFTVRYTGGQSVTVPFSGTLQGDKMEGTFQAGEVTGKWAAERAK